MTSPSIFDYGNDQMRFALMENDCSLDVEEVEPRTEKNLRNCLRYAMRTTFESYTNHSLYVLINGKNWLSDPLTHIKEAAESVNCSIVSTDLKKRKFSVQKDSVQLDIFFHGEGEEPQEEDDGAEKQVVDPGVLIEILDSPEKQAVKKEVVEILDSDSEGNGDSSSESESEYEDFTDHGLTQFVGQVHGAPYELPRY